MEEPITIRFRWTADELLLGYRYHYRQTCRPLIQFGLNVCMAIMSLGAAIGCFQTSGADFAVIFAIMCVGVYWLAVRPCVRRWTIRRRFAKRPDKDTEIEWRLTPEKVCISHIAGHSECSWEMYAKVVRTPMGLLFYPIKEIFHWLPRHGFASDAEFERAAELAKAKVRRFYKVA